MITQKRLIVTMIAVVSTLNAHAEVSSAEAKQLGGSRLTIVGAERAGNKDGTIPEFDGATGEVIKAPPNHDYKVNGGVFVNPWNDKALFSVTAQNAAKYADKLDGLQEMFAKYPNFRMDVYASHRTASFPKYVQDNTIKNATGCKLEQNGLKLEGCYGGSPFPIPKSGIQVVWNHLLAYDVYTQVAKFEAYSVGVNGAKVLQNRVDGIQQWPFYDPKQTKPAEPRTLFWALRGDTVAPARKVGEKLVILDAVDMANIGRRAYQYIPGQRRVKLAPDLAYDTPSPYGGGTITMDDGRIFLGAPDRYDWKLVGKKEKFIPYNNFSITNPKLCPADKMFGTANFPNPDCVRWELHRVWVVEGVLKPGFRHIYKKRILFLDEDGYSGGVSEQYDAGDRLYRVGFVLIYPFYDGAGQQTSTTAHIDLQTGSYAMQGFPGSEGVGVWPAAVPKPDNFFSPEALAGEGIR